MTDTDTTHKTTEGTVDEPILWTGAKFKIQHSPGGDTPGRRLHADLLAANAAADAVRLSARRRDRILQVVLVLVVLVAVVGPVLWAWLRR